MNIRAKIFGNGDTDGQSPVVAAKKPKGAKADTLNSIPVIREATRRGDTRNKDRHRLPDEQVRVTHNGCDCDAQLLNLSGGGAMITGALEPMLWDRVELHLGENGTIECAVRWLKGDRIGLEFSHETRLECSADEQAVLLRDVIARSFPDIEFEATAELETDDLPGGEEQRADGRHPLIWSGVIHHDYQTSNVRLRNISDSGAMIECSAPLRSGAELLLDLGASGSVMSTVTWVAGDSAGLRFHEPYDLTQLARSRPEIAPARWQRPPYLQPGTAADSPWDGEWNRMSLGELRQELEGFLKR